MRLDGGHVATRIISITPIARALCRCAGAALAIAAASCVGAGAAPAPVAAPSDVVTSAELASLGAGVSAYTALEHLRPRFLNPPLADPRGAGPGVNVLLNGVYAGGVDVLGQIPAREVASMRFVPRSQAYALLGQRIAGDGVIEVVLRRVR